MHLDGTFTKSIDMNFPLDIGSLILTIIPLDIGSLILKIIVLKDTYIH